MEKYKSLNLVWSHKPKQTLQKANSFSLLVILAERRLPTITENKMLIQPAWKINCTAGVSEILGRNDKAKWLVDSQNKQIQDIQYQQGFHR